jgi:Ser/Thr protein kinase RdoA (MazF antagonist)
VKQFSEMNEAEQKAWWLEQAKIALQTMQMPDARVEWLAYTHNAVFEVNYQNQRYTLRLQEQKPNSHLLAEEEVLGFFHAHGLRNRVPLPKQIYQSDTIIGLLCSFVEGKERQAEQISPNDMQAIGEFLRILHRTESFYMPIVFGGGGFPDYRKGDLPHLDWLGLFGQFGNYALDEKALSVFNNEQVSIMNRVTEYVRYAMNNQNQYGKFGLIHGDLLLKNILFHEGEVRALDFEYCGWGYYLYDLCPLLWQLKPLSNYNELEEALWKSYCYQNPNTRDHRQLLETFIAGRQVASMRWVAANQHNPAYQGKVESILQQRTAELQGFLETGILKRS